MSKPYGRMVTMPRAMRSRRIVQPGRPVETGVSGNSKAVRDIPVRAIRPEEGLSRKRAREGHEELCNSIRKFGVLTPITVRPDPSEENGFLLIKGQGRTLAASLVGMETIPAIVVDENFNDEEKVQQFLVENVARLKMRPADRALLVAHARQAGEETRDVAQKFGITAQTVRRLEAQLRDVGTAEIEALRSGRLSLGLHAVIAQHVAIEERNIVIDLLNEDTVSPGSLDTLLIAIGWKKMHQMGSVELNDRMNLLRWCLQQFTSQPKKIKPRERMILLANSLAEVIQEPEILSA